MTYIMLLGLLHALARQLVAYMATFGTQFFSFKFYLRHLFTKFVMLKTNKWNEMHV